MESDQKRRFIQKITILPTIPVVFYKIIQCADDPKSSASDLKNTILNDQSISAKVLNLANSAYYGFMKQVKDVTQAIVVLGFDTVVDVAISVSILKAFEGIKSEEFDKEKFWIHSLAAAETAKLIGKKKNLGSLEFYFVLGLLHDIGKVILSNFFTDDYDTALLDARASDSYIRESEKKIFGFDHTDAGGWLGEKWKFPNRIILPIRFHHQIEKLPADFNEEIYITYLANYLASVSEIGFSGNYKEPFLNEIVLTKLSFNNDDVTALTKQLKKLTPKIETFFEALNK